MHRLLRFQLCILSTLLCSVWILQPATIISPIQRSSVAFIIEANCVFCGVRN
jgi:hypothetical protein